MGKIILKGLHHGRLEIRMPPNAVRNIRPIAVIRYTAAQLIVGMVQHPVVAQIQEGMGRMPARCRQDYIAGAKAV